MLDTYFVYGPHALAPTYMVKQGVQYKIHFTPQGSIRYVLDMAGAIVQEIEYNEYGMVTSDTNPGFQPLGYNSGLWDSETELVRFGARDYDPSIGRWTTKDPIGFAGGDTNLYGYVANDPVNWVDPSGLARGDWWDPRTYVLPVVEGGQGATDFVRNYNNMRSANTIGADKYFHCMANCQSTQRGPGGLTAAEIIGEGRELTDQYIKGDSRQACDADRAANSQGRNGAGGGACSQVCGSLRPNGLGSQW